MDLEGHRWRRSFFDDLPSGPPPDPSDPFDDAAHNAAHTGIDAGVDAGADTLDEPTRAMDRPDLSKPARRPRPRRTGDLPAAPTREPQPSSRRRAPAPEPARRSEPADDDPWDPGRFVADEPSWDSWGPDPEPALGADPALDLVGDASVDAGPVAAPSPLGAPTGTVAAPSVFDNMPDLDGEQPWEPEPGPPRGPRAPAGPPRIRAHYLERGGPDDGNSADAWNDEWAGEATKTKRDDVRGPGMSASDFFDEVKLFFIGVSDTIERSLAGLERLPSAWMGRYAVHVLRIGLGLLLVWFGTLKLATDQFPAAALVEASLDQIGFPTTAGRYLLGGVEVAIGIGLLADVRRRALVWLLMAHLLVTALPLALVPELTWTAAPYNPNGAGQDLLKNLVLVGAVMAIRAAVDDEEPSDEDPFADLVSDEDDPTTLPGPEPEPSDLA